MTIKEILNSTEHRPWKIPAKNWQFYQEWNNAVFLHWQVELTELEAFVPNKLEIDLFEGKAWVSLVIFKMEKIRPKLLPSFAPVSDFDELNIRTYVKFNNKCGVYFLSIEANKILSCMVAKGISGLPYRHSIIQRTTNRISSHNSELKDKLKIEYAIGNEALRKTELDKWLTERYALFHDTNSCINEFEIHHVAWPVDRLELNKLRIDYPRFSKLINDKPDKMHYSKGVQVIAWGKSKTKY
jgi:uncharacterized protein YqjF (DUF2071 family)